MARSDYRFSHGLRVRYSEIDVQGIVYNAHYLTYADIAVTEYMRSVGITFDMDEARKSGEDAHVVKASVEWKAPARADQELDLCVRTERLGNSSMTFSVEIHPRGEDNLLARCEIIWVNANQATRKSCPLPVDWVNRLRAFEGERLSA